MYLYGHFLTMGWGGGGLVLLFQSHTFGALLPIGNLYRQIGLRSIWQTFKVRLWNKTKYRSNIIEVFPSSVLSRRQSMTIFCATFTHLHLCCLKKSMSFSGVRYPIWFNSISNFAKKWFIQYLIQYCLPKIRFKV